MYEYLYMNRYHICIILDTYLGRGRLVANGVPYQADLLKGRDGLQAPVVSKTR